MCRAPPTPPPAAAVTPFAPVAVVDAAAAPAVAPPPLRVAGLAAGRYLVPAPLPFFPPCERPVADNADFRRKVLLLHTAWHLLLTSAAAATRCAEDDRRGVDETTTAALGCGEHESRGTSYEASDGDERPELEHVSMEAPSMELDGLNCH